MRKVYKDNIIESECIEYDTLDLSSDGIRPGLQASLMCAGIMAGIENFKNLILQI